MNRENDGSRGQRPDIAPAVLKASHNFSPQESLMNRVASPLAPKILGIILCASLMAGCAAAAPDPAAIQPRNPPPPAPDIRASGPSGRDTEAAPIPTPEAPFVTPITAPDPTAEPPERGTAASAPGSNEPDGSELLSSLESLPLEFGGRASGLPTRNSPWRWAAPPGRDHSRSSSPCPRTSGSGGPGTPVEGFPTS